MAGIATEIHGVATIELGDPPVDLPRTVARRAGLAADAFARLLTRGRKRCQTLPDPYRTIAIRIIGNVTLVFRNRRRDLAVALPRESQQFPRLGRPGMRWRCENAGRELNGPRIIVIEKRAACLREQLWQRCIGKRAGTASCRRAVTPWLNGCRPGHAAFGC